MDKNFLKNILGGKNKSDDHKNEADEIFNSPMDKNGFPEKPPLTFARLLEELKGGYVLDQIKDRLVTVNSKPIDHISFGGNEGVDFVGVEKSEKPPLTFARLLEELKGGYVLDQVKDLHVLVDGKPIDHISFGDTIDFVGK